MDIRLKALLRVVTVLVVGFVGVVSFYAMTIFLSDAVLLGIVVGALVGILLYNLYRIFLAMEEMKESNKK